MKPAKIFFKDKFAGILERNSEGYTFTYDKEYLADSKAQAIAISLSLSESTYASKTLFPFFDGLIPEGWLLNVVIDNWQINPRDRMGLLLKSCEDCVGAVSVIEVSEDAQ